MSFSFAAISWNQPKICPSAQWDQNSASFASSSVVGSLPSSIFVTRNNTVVLARRDTGTIVGWQNGSSNARFTIPSTVSSGRSIFVTNDDEILVDNQCPDGQVERWTMNGTQLHPSIIMGSTCYGLFVDINDDVYCSHRDKHQITRRPLNTHDQTFTVVAGTGCAGSASHMLSSPRGIFVTINRDLYVADSGNDRIQYFRHGETNGTTVVGVGAPGTITLNNPVAVILDADENMYISDEGNGMIVKSGPYGSQCIIGCRLLGLFALSSPRQLSFDPFGNLYLADFGLDKAMKFMIQNNNCGKREPLLLIWL